MLSDRCPVCPVCPSVTLVYCGHIKMKLGTEVSLGPGHVVLDEDPVSPQKGHSSPHFSAHVYCGQRARWIKKPLGTEVGIGLGHIVLDRDPTTPPPKGGAHPSIYGPCLL